MSVQSTTHITRKGAEEKLVKKIIEEEHTRIIQSYVASLSDEEIEDRLESTFDNYMIMDYENED